VYVKQEGDQWTAEVYEDELRDSVLITQGNSPLHAVWMAWDALRLFHDQCKDSSTKHCWCRKTFFDDTTSGEKRKRTPALECCHCGTRTRTDNV